MSWVWARRVSPYITRPFLRTPISANQITGLMILVGLAGAAVLALPGLVGAALSVVLIELYLLLDCVDGEVARWRSTTSIMGKYLDRVGHYVVEAALLAAYGYHVAQDWRSPWLTLSVAVALLAILTKSCTDLQISSGAVWEGRTHDEIVTPKPRGLRRLRTIAQATKFHRWTGAVEASLLMLIAAIAVELGWDHAEYALLVAFAVISAALFPAHLLSILVSNRLDTPS